MKNLIKNGNYYLNIGHTASGMRYSQRLVPEDMDASDIIPEFPELVDLKITNACSAGCAWCYQDSRHEVRDARTNLDFAKSLIDQLPSYVELAIGGGDVMELDDEYLSELFDMSARFPSRNFTINIKSITMIVNAVNHPNEHKLKACFDHASAIGISVNNHVEVNNMITFAKKLNLDISKVCFHIIPDIMRFEEVEKTLITIKNAGLGCLLLGYKSFGRGITYQKKVTNHDVQSIQDLIKRFVNQGMHLKVDTKLDTDYELGQNLYEGEFSCNIDAPLGTVSPSSWRNKEQFLDENGSFAKTFANIRQAQGFESHK